MKKVKASLKSRRFWYAVILGVAMFLDKAEILTGSYEAALQAIQAFSAVGIGVLTVDKFK